MRLLNFITKKKHAINVNPQNYSVIMLIDGKYFKYVVF